MANDDAAREAGGDAPIKAEHFSGAATDYFPSRDVELLEYMELLAVFEASSRRLLPPKYASTDTGGAGRAAATAEGDSRKPAIGCFRLSVSSTVCGLRSTADSRKTADCRLKTGTT